MLKCFRLFQFLRTVDPVCYSALGCSLELDSPSQQDPSCSGRSLTPNCLVSGLLLSESQWRYARCKNYYAIDHSCGLGFFNGFYSLSLCKEGEEVMCVLVYTVVIVHEEVRRQLSGVGSFFPPMNPGHQTKAFRLGIRCLFPLSHLAGSRLPALKGPLENFSVEMSHDLFK